MKCAKCLLPRQLIRTLILPAVVLIAPRLHAQAVHDSSATLQCSNATEPKSEKTATILSMFLPGFGHFYAEDNRTGTILATAFAGACLIGACGENATSSPIALLLVGVPYWYGVIDAHHAVQRYNRAHAKTARVELHPRLIVISGVPARLGIGMRIDY